MTVLSPIIENQTERKMENEMETGISKWFIGIGDSKNNTGPVR